jgi:predicted dithiol-disulfide oxidoreductase (DUF899 family)
VRFPNESPEYRAARDALLAQEVELRRATEAAAEARRALPPGGEIPQDYVFEEAGGEVRFSELFAPDKDTLAIYSFMFPRHVHDDRPGPTTGTTAALPLHEGPCPSCVALLDQLDRAAFHSAPYLNFAAVARTTADRLHAYGQERGWQNLRLLSAAGNSYPADYGAEPEDDGPVPMLNVFHRDGDAIRHFWGSELFYEPAPPGEDPRHLGTLEPVWNLFDLTPEGRGGARDEQLAY